LVPFGAGRAWHLEASSERVTLYKHVLVLVRVIEVTGIDVLAGAGVLLATVVAGSTTTTTTILTVLASETRHAVTLVVRVVNGARARAAVLTRVRVARAQLQFALAACVWWLAHTGVGRMVGNTFSTILAWLISAWIGFLLAEGSFIHGLALARELIPVSNTRGTVLTWCRITGRRLIAFTIDSCITIWASALVFVVALVHALTSVLARVWLAGVWRCLADVSSVAVLTFTLVVLSVCNTLTTVLTWVRLAGVWRCLANVSSVAILTFTLVVLSVCNTLSTVLTWVRCAGVWRSLADVSCVSVHTFTPVVLSISNAFASVLAWVRRAGVRWSLADVSCVAVHTFTPVVLSISNAFASVLTWVRCAGVGRCLAYVPGVSVDTVTLVVVAIGFAQTSVLARVWFARVLVFASVSIVTAGTFASVAAS